MDKLKSWLYGILAAVVIGTGSWAWGYAFSAENRITKLEVQFSFVKEQLDRIENKVEKIIQSKDK